jgi:hypothetical protein
MRFRSEDIFSPDDEKCSVDAEASDFYGILKTAAEQRHVAM